MSIKYADLLFYLVIIFFISFSKIKYRKITNIDRIICMSSIIIISYYDNISSVLFFILYILYLTNVEDKFIESFSVKNKEGIRDLNNVLKFLKTPKSKKILETMFIKNNWYFEWNKKINNIIMHKFFLFFSILILILIINYKYVENFSSNNGMGSDEPYNFVGPFDYDQDPNLEYANDQNQGMGSDKSYVFDGPYNYDQNPLLWSN